MKKLCYLIILVFLGFNSFSQQNYFIYIQSDDRLPFYVVLNSKVYSSSEIGYLIIPKLGDSSYQLVIGFAKNAFPEQRFQVAVNRKDQGFQLKNLSEKGWGLLNLQTMSLIMGTGGLEKPTTGLTGTKKTDAFSALLANVVNDTAILYTAYKAPAAPASKEPVVNTVVPEQTTVIDTQSVAVQQPDQTGVPPAVTVEPVEDTASTTLRDTAIASVPVTDPEPVATIIKEKKEQKQAVETEPSAIKPEKPFISKFEERTTGEMYRAVYLEQYSLVTDTIVVSIPLDESPLAVPAASKEDNPVAVKSVPDVPVPSVKKESTDPVLIRKPAVVVMNSDCKNFATEYDIDKLRVRLINDKTIEDKTGSVKKFLKNRCITVSQVRALTELFPTDETKLQFFKISYPFVSDTSNVYLLEEMLQGNLYKNQLREMIAQ